MNADAAPGKTGLYVAYDAETGDVAVFLGPLGRYGVYVRPATQEDLERLPAAEEGGVPGLPGEPWTQEAENRLVAEARSLRQEPRP